MIYLKNTSGGQEVFIAREGTITATTGHSSSWEEGYQSGRTDGYQEGFEDGELEGRAYQKSLLSELTVTDNGTYSDEDGYGVVNVNVDKSGAWHDGYVSGVTDGEVIGIASGISHQRSLLSAITITANTAITRADGWSAITVNVPQSGMSGTEIPLTGSSYSADSYGRYYFDYDPTDPISSITVYFTVQPEPGQYFTTKSLANSNVITGQIRTGATNYATSLSVSTDSGQTWQTITVDGTVKDLSVTLQSGQTAIWKGIGTSWHQGLRFSATKNYEVEGNIMSLLYGDDFGNKTAFENNSYALAWIFTGSTTLVNAGNLVLPATTLADGCYCGMFADCSKLTTAPELPATTLSTNCYGGMFANCTSLTTAPSLPATNLADECYFGMFNGCRNLTTAPSILPATTLAKHCYYTMFSGCGKITTAPVLPATSLSYRWCYMSMFHGCYSLASITCLATDLSGEDCTTDWVDGVSRNGTFTKAASMNDWTTGDNGIPNGWTVIDAS